MDRKHAGYTRIISYNGPRRETPAILCFCAKKTYKRKQNYQ